MYGFLKKFKNMPKFLELTNNYLSLSHAKSLYVTFLFRFLTKLLMWHAMNIIVN